MLAVAGVLRPAVEEHVAAVDGRRQRAQPRDAGGRVGVNPIRPWETMRDAGGRERYFGLVPGGRYAVYPIWRSW